MAQEDCYIVERLNSRLDDRVCTVESTAARCDLDACLHDSLDAIWEIAGDADSASLEQGVQHVGAVARELFEILTSRRFTACSKRESSDLRTGVLEQISGFVAEGSPIKFYLDLGGGYSAAVCLQDLCGGDFTRCLSFKPNFLHVLCLAQIARFAKAVRQVYPPGIRMTLVIDDLVANYVNDIPLADTAAFCLRLQALIEKLGLQNLVGLLVESKVSRFARCEVVCREVDRGIPLGDYEYENVLRFSGRMLSREEAAHRMRLYCATCELSERYLAEVIDGIHLTQRKEAATLSFRSFPGGCARIQAGRACFVRNPRMRMVPKLLTTSNVHGYRICYVPSQFSDAWTVGPVPETAPDDTSE